MNNLKTILILLAIGVASVSFSQNSPIGKNHGSNFKIAIAPTLGYISFNQTSFGYNINNAFFGGQLAVYNERSTLKKSYLRPQFNYLYHVKRITDHDFVFNHYVSFNPEYFFRIKNKFELGAGVNLGITKRDYQLPYSYGSRHNWQLMKGFSMTGIYNFGRFFSSISANYNRVSDYGSLAPNQSDYKQKNLQFLFRLGLKL